MSLIYTIAINNHYTVKKNEVERIFKTLLKVEKACLVVEFSLNNSKIRLWN